jgi:hypothetical protein
MSSKKLFIASTVLRGHAAFTETKHNSNHKTHQTTQRRNHIAVEVE